MIPRYAIGARAFIGCAMLILTQPVRAAGFYISEVGTPGSLGTAVAPQGGGVSYGDDFVGRYGATRVALAAVGGSPSIACKVKDRTPESTNFIEETKDE